MEGHGFDVFPSSFSVDGPREEPVVSVIRLDPQDDVPVIGDGGQDVVGSEDPGTALGDGQAPAADQEVGEGLEDVPESQADPGVTDAAEAVDLAPLLAELGTVEDLQKEQNDLLDKLHAQVVVENRQIAGLRNFSVVAAAGFGLVIGVLLVLVLSNYLRH